MKEYLDEAVALLRRLISIEGFSRQENDVADAMEARMREYGLSPIRIQNNLLLGTDNLTEGLPTILLNAHLDTVKPVASWTRNPFSPTLEGEVLYGLGSNDCGGGLVTLLQIYRIFSTDKKFRQRYNILYLASAEEEVSGKNGMELMRDILTGKTSSTPSVPKVNIDLAIVGEPTGMRPAIAEKGLMVIDIIAYGKAGHAARAEGVNAIYEALSAMNWLHTYQFERVSPLLGPTRMTLTAVHAGQQHNVIPDRCELLVDVRTNELYTNEEVYEIIRDHIATSDNRTIEVKPRSFRLSSSHIDCEHPAIKFLDSIGRMPFGSPTLSDQALMPWPSFKLGPGESSRSHTADEFIRISELQDALETYANLLETLCNTK